MAGIDVLAGDFKQGPFSHLFWGKLQMQRRRKWFRERIKPSEIAKLELLTKENSGVAGALGFGLAGEVLFGPMGMLAGALIGSRRKKATFVCQFKDGRKFLGTASAKTFSRLQRMVLAENF